MLFPHSSSPNKNIKVNLNLNQVVCFDMKFQHGTERGFLGFLDAQETFAMFSIFITRGLCLVCKHTVTNPEGFHATA